MSLAQPPKLPALEELPFEIRDYLRQSHDFLVSIYKILKTINIDDTGLYTGDTIPPTTLGQDGDLYVRKDGANTSLWQNVNGAWIINS